MTLGAQPVLKDDSRVPDIGALALDPGMGLRLAQIVVFKDLGATFRPFDLSPAEFAALTIINENPGLRLGLLAEMLMILQPNLAGFVGGLEKRGLIIRSRDAGDKRSFLLSLTSAGTELLAAAEIAHDGHRQRIADHLGIADRDLLARILNKLASFRPIEAV